MGKFKNVASKLPTGLYNDMVYHCRENTISKSQFVREAVKNQLNSDIEIQSDSRSLNQRYADIKRNIKPVERKANFRDRVFNYLQTNLNKEAPPEPDLFEDSLNQFREEISDYQDKYDEYHNYINWCMYIYRMCHPVGKYDWDVMVLCFRMVENGEVSGKTAMGRILWDVVQKHTGIPDKYFVDAWREATNQYRDDWEGEWKGAIESNY